MLTDQQKVQLATNTARAQVAATLARTCLEGGISPQHAVKIYREVLEELRKPAPNPGDAAGAAHQPSST